MRARAASVLRTLIVEQKHLVVSGFSSFIIRIGGLVSAFLLGVVLARALGPADYGIYGLVISLSAMAMNIALLGTPQLAVREMAVRSAKSDWDGCRSLANRFLTATVGSSILLGAIALAAAYLVAGHEPKIIEASWLGVLITIAVGIGALAAAELRGLGRLEKGQFMDILGRPAAALLITALIASGSTLNAATALEIQLAVTIAATAISLVWLRHAMPVAITAPRPAGWRWLKAALPLGFVDILKQFDGTYGIILVGLFASARDLGIYRVALSSTVIANMPVTILHVVLAPTVSRLFRFGDREELQQLLRTASGVMCASIAPMIIVLLLFGQALVGAIFGAAYANAWLPLALLCGAQLALGIFGMGPVLLAMADSERHLARIYASAVVTGVAVAALLIPRLGMTGAALAQLISTAIIGIRSHRFARRHLGLGTTFLSRPTPQRPEAD